MRIRIIFLLLFYVFLYRNVFSKSILLLNNNTVLKKTKFEYLHKWDEENFDEALNVFIENCYKIQNLYKQKNIFPQIDKKFTKDDFFTVCKVASTIKNYNQKYKQIFFEKFFIPYEIVKNKDENSLFTGYYIPIINAKTTKDNIFKYPIYGRPKELSNYQKYYTRKEITQGILNGRNLEILYTDNLVDLFFAHIQGSTYAYLADKQKMILLGFDGKNNCEYSSIGKYLVNNNYIDKDDLNSLNLKNELKKFNENFILNIFNINESYVFFKIIDNSIISGSFGTPLREYRTIAVDRNNIPLGFPLWLTTDHVTKNSRKEFNKLVIANDTGSAIKGSVRGDIFFGYGKTGEEQASYQHSNGKYFILIPERIVRKL